MCEFLWWLSDWVEVVVADRQAVVRFFTFKGANGALQGLSDVGVVADVWLRPRSMYPAWALHFFDVLSDEFCPFLKRVAVLVRQIQLIFSYFVFFKDFIDEVHLWLPLEVTFLLIVYLWSCKATASEKRNIISLVFLGKWGKKGSFAL